MLGWWGERFWFHLQNVHKYFKWTCFDNYDLDRRYYSKFFGLISLVNLASEVRSQRRSVKNISEDQPQKPEKNQKPEKKSQKPSKFQDFCHFSWFSRAGRSGPSFYAPVRSWMLVLFYYLMVLINNHLSFFTLRARKPSKSSLIVPNLPALEGTRNTVSVLLFLWFVFIFCFCLVSSDFPSGATTRHCFGLLLEVTE